MTHPSFTPLRDIRRIQGTSLVGTVHCTYDQLLEFFGPPTEMSMLESKIDVRWRLLYKYRTVITIYNWKDGPRYLGKDGTAVKDITTWHIGGFDEMAYHHINNLLD